MEDYERLASDVSVSLPPALVAPPELNDQVTSCYSLPKVM